MSNEKSKSLTYEWYEAFQRAEFARWDAITTSDVLLNSPAGRDVRGLDTFKKFASQFTDLAYRIDLVDEHLALDAERNGRGFVTFCLHWKHTKDFGGLAPTEREGTSVETAIFTIRRGKIVRIDVGDNSLDLVIYMWERNWPIPHNMRPDPVVAGIDRRGRNGDSK
jgi:ketosteroid isomerase-like protein